MSEVKKIAVVLCQFPDVPTNAVIPKKYYQQLFTNPNFPGIPAFWKYVSFGNVECAPVNIFGWKEIPKPYSTIMTETNGRADRMRYILRNYFPEVKEANYDSIVIIHNASGDSGNQGKAVWVAHNNRHNVTFMLHELAHALFGLGHSFDLSGRQNATWSQPGEYFDLLDLMSAMRVYKFERLVTYDSHENVKTVCGPQLCSYYIHDRKWYPKKRYINIRLKHDTRAFKKTITLNSLSNQAGDNPLIVQIGPFFVEFRTPDVWDQGIPNAGIVIHGAKKTQTGKIRPWVIAPDLDNPNVQIWKKGQIFRSLDYSTHFPIAGLTIKVDDIQNSTAVVTIKYSPPPKFSVLLKIRTSDSQVFVSGNIEVHGWNSQNSPKLNIAHKLLISLKGKDGGLRFSDDHKYEFPLLNLKTGNDTTPDVFSFKKTLSKGVLNEDRGVNDRDEIYAEAEITGYDNWKSVYRSNEAKGYF